MFASLTLDSHTDTDFYASSVLDCIDSNIDSVTTLKRITTFPNQKPWMNKEVQLNHSTTSMAALTGTRRRWPSRLCSQQTTSPSHWAGFMHERLLVLMVSPDVSSGQCCAVWTDIVNLSLLTCQAAVSNCFKTSSIVPVPKHSTAASLDDFCPVALTPHHHKVLREAGPGSLQNQSTTNTGPPPISLPPEHENRSCHLYAASFCPLPPR